MSRLLALLAVLCVSVEGAGAQPGADGSSVRRPVQAGRVVHLFDFEEREDNPLPVPRWWVRAQDDPAAGRQRPGFPVFNRGELDYTTAHRGEGSLRLWTKGGSAAMRLETGALNIFPTADYMVSAKVRTEGMVHARAALVAEVLDAAGEVLLSRRSELVRTEPGSWETAMVSIPHGEARGAYLRIELLLLQPREFEAPVLGVHQVWREDLGATVWFDDVGVIQLPNISFTTRAPANIVVEPALPELLVEVRDLAGQALSAHVLVQDIDARRIVEERFELGLGTSVHRFAPPLGDYGWYRATLTLTAGELRVGTRYVDFLYLGERDPGAERSVDRERFALSATTPSDALLDLMPAIAREAGCGSVALPIWGEALTPEDIPERLSKLQHAVDRLETLWVRPSFVLAGVPRVVRSRAPVDGDDPMGLLGLDPELWGPFLTPFLDRFGQGVKRWQVGGDGSAMAGGHVVEWLAAAAADISQLVPGPEIALGLRADRGLDPSFFSRASPVTSASWYIPPGLSEQSIATLAATWDELARAGDGARDLSLVIGTLDERRFGGRAAMTDAARKVVEAWAHFGDEHSTGGRAALTLHEPWAWREGELMPAPGLGLWRTLQEQLRDRRSAGLVDLGPGVRCHVLAPLPGRERDGALVVWRDGSGEPRVRAFLGSGPVVASDLFGNRTGLQRVEGGREGQGEHEIPVGDAPIFIEGVDIHMLRFVSSMRLEPEFVEAEIDRHDMEVVLENPWPVRIEGKLLIVEPGGFGGSMLERERTWRIAPRSIPFSIAPGGTARLPFWMSFSAGEESGRHRFAVEMDLAADRDYTGLGVSTEFEIGIKELEMDLTYRLGEGDTLLVEARVTNRGLAPSSLRLLAFAPGHARQSATIMDLEPGVTATRRFALAPGPGGSGGAGALTGDSVVVSLIDLDHGRRLNKSILIE